MTRAQYRSYDPPLFDEYGRITNCHFFHIKGTSKVCTALCDFYNADNIDIDRLCENCPFFKTDAEFWDDYHKVH